MKKLIVFFSFVILQVVSSNANESELKTNKHENEFELKTNKLHKIVNGREVRPMFKYPYQVFFLAGKFKCGGTIIGKRHVLTAAHCIKGSRPTYRTYVIVGRHRIHVRDAFGPNAEHIFGSNIIRVKNFIKYDRNTDIGMLELERDIEFSSRIAPACIPVKNAENFAGRDAVVTGWGGTVGYSPGQYVRQRASEVLMETTLGVLAPDSRLCRKAFGSTADKICSYREGHDTCQGDSGGPMTIKENGKFVLIGVTSSGKGCGAYGHAGISMRVSYFHDWIADNVRDVCTSQSGRPTSATAHKPVHTRPSNNRPEVTRPITKPRPMPSSGTPASADCSCSDFTNRYGFGRCRKSDSDFGGRRSCYVNLPTTCSDLVRSSSNWGKFLSADACKSGFTSKPTRPVVITTPKPSNIRPVYTRPISTHGNNRPEYSRPVSKPVNNRPEYSRPVSKPVNNRPEYSRPVSKPVNNRPQYSRPVSKPVNNRPDYSRPVSKPVNTRPVSKPLPTPVTSTSGCSCSNFVNRNGFGRCLKKDSDFGHQMSCYVNLPSSCGDLIRSGSNWGKFLSAEACQTRPFSQFKKKEFKN